MSEGGKP